jgi:peptidoglycan hydrolase-like protein with peptidoglycan-binding domain
MLTSWAPSVIEVSDRERAQRRRFVALALCMGAACACAATPAAATPTANVSFAAVSDSSGYLSRLNSERAAHGLAPLIMRSDLTQIAQSWSTHMAASGVLAHNPSLASEVTNWLAVGENVGDGPSISDLDAAFMASPTHRDNVLDPSYDDVGIATVTRNGTIWITVDFRDIEHAEPLTQTVTQTTSAAAHTAPGTSTPYSAVSAPTRPAGSLLMLGSSGVLVRMVQHRVRVAADGIFGPVTRHAVRKFQRRHRLVVDGIVGPRTWRALRRHGHGKRHSPVQHHCSGLSLSCAG